MDAKKFFISLIKNIIILLVATLIFSSITLDFPSLLQGVFGDVYEYAKPETQKRVIAELAETCSSLESGNAVTMSQICSNRTLLESMKANCADYEELKRKGGMVENEEQVRETCLQIESGEIERQCNEMKKSSLLPDFSKIGALCKDYKAGKIDDKKFFYGVVSSPLGSGHLPSVGIFDRYNKAVGYLNSNKIFYFIILTILLALLYLLIKDQSLFLSMLAGISFSIGILILIPYLGIVLYDKLVGIDTTSILNSMFGLGGFDLKSILSVVLLLFLRTYNNFIITTGIVFLGIGLGGKIYGKFWRKAQKTNPKNKKPGKEKKKKD